MASIRPLNRGWLLRLVGCCAVACALGPTEALAAPPSAIVFYDPDANHQAILAITTRVNKYLETVHPGLSFQPVQSQKAFELAISKDKAAFAIVTSLVLRSRLAEKLNLKPLLVPQADDKVHYQKVLVTLSGKTLKSLKGVTTAVAVIDKDPRRAAKDALRMLQSEQISVKGAVVVPVSKDIDALLALSFRQAEAALVTSKSIEILKRINPSLHRSLKLQHRTRPILRSPLCAVTGRAGAAEVDLIKKAFLEMPGSKPGRQSMDLLGFQRWVEFKNTMWR